MRSANRTLCASTLNKLSACCWSLQPVHRPTCASSSRSSPVVALVTALVLSEALALALDVPAANQRKMRRHHRILDSVAIQFYNGRLKILTPILASKARIIINLTRPPPGQSRQRGP